MTVEHPHSINKTSAVLLQFVLASERDTWHVIEQMQKLTGGVFSDRIYFETIFLRAVMVDYRTTVLLGDSPRRNEILDTFYVQLQEAAHANPTGRAVLEGLRTRLLLYSEAIQSAMHDDAGWAVGRTFASLFDQVRNGFVVMFERSLYDDYYRYVASIIRRHEEERSTRDLHENRVH